MAPHMAIIGHISTCSLPERLSIYGDWNFFRRLSARLRCQLFSFVFAASYTRKPIISVIIWVGENGLDEIFVIRRFSAVQVFPDDDSHLFVCANDN